MEVQGISSTPLFSRSALRTCLLVCCALLVVAPIAYLAMFNGVGWFDDEGFFLATIKAVLEKHVLFDQVYTLYGPFYYLVEWLFYVVTGLPVTIDSIRWLGFVYWCFGSLALTYSAYRFSRSWVVPALALIEFSKLLTFFQWSPGHPEELGLVVLSILILVLPDSLPEVFSTKRLIVIGALLAALAQIKVNLGLYSFLAVILTLLVASAKRRWSIGIAGAAVCLSLILVTVVLSSLSRFVWVRVFFVVFLIALLLVAAESIRIRPRIDISWKAWSAFALAYLSAFAAIILPFLLHGTSLAAFFYVTVLQHRHFTAHWFNVSNFGMTSLACCAGSFALYLYWRANGSNSRAATIVQVTKAVLALYVALLLLGHNMNWPVPTTISSTVTPFAWLVLVPANGGNRAGPSFLTRISLAFLAVFINLYGFPVARAQAVFGIVPLLLVALIWLDDSLNLLQVSARITQFRTLKRIAAAATCIMLALSYGRQLHHDFDEYASGVPLGLPGSTQIRTSPNQAATFHWLVGKLNAECPQYFSMPGLFTPYFWTGQDPPTLLMINDWMGFLTPGQQRQVIHDLVSHSTACIIYNRELVDFWHAQRLLKSSALATYIFSFYSDEATRGGYTLMKRIQAANPTSQPPRKKGFPGSS